MNLIPIGQFSQMTRLSSKALRLYDKSGLLPPAYVDPATGYRYYELTQANRAEAVRILRSVEMPLDEIKAVLESADPDLVHKRLAIHRERLASRLADDERMLAYLETLMNRSEGIMPYTITIEEAAPQLVAATRFHTSLANASGAIAAGFTVLVPAIGQAGVAPTGPPLLVHHDVIDEQTAGEIEICIPVDGSVPGEHSDVYSRELEGGEVATTVHHGRYEQIAPAYHTLTGWIAENGYEVAGPPREIYLNDPQVVPPDELETRVEFPIRQLSVPPEE